MLEAVGVGASLMALLVMLVEKAVKVSSKLEILNQKINALDERLDKMELKVK